MSDILLSELGAMVPAQQEMTTHTMQVERITRELLVTPVKEYLVPQAAAQDLMKRDVTLAEPESLSDEDKKRDKEFDQHMQDTYMSSPDDGRLDGGEEPNRIGRGMTQETLDDLYKDEPRMNPDGSLLPPIKEQSLPDVLGVLYETPTIVPSQLADRLGRYIDVYTFFDREKLKEKGLSNEDDKMKFFAEGLFLSLQKKEDEICQVTPHEEGERTEHDYLSESIGSAIININHMEDHSRFSKEDLPRLARLFRYYSEIMKREKPTKEVSFFLQEFSTGVLEFSGIFPTDLVAKNMLIEAAEGGRYLGLTGMQGIAKKNET